MSNHCLDIKLFDNHALVTRPGSTLSKPLGVADLINVLSESAQGVLNYSRVESLRLPDGAYFTAYAGNKLNLCLYYPERPVTLQHLGGSSGTPKKFDVMMPNVVIHLVLNVSNNGGKHTVENAFYYSTPVERENLPSTIPGRLRKVFSWLPFPNCYDNFKLCYGHNQMFNSVEGGDLRIFNAYYQVLAGSPFNNDLRLMNVPEYQGNNRDWFNKLAQVYKDEKRFPYELVSY